MCRELPALIYFDLTVPTLKGEGKKSLAVDRFIAISSFSRTNETRRDIVCRSETVSSPALYPIRAGMHLSIDEPPTLPPPTRKVVVSDQKEKNPTTAVRQLSFDSALNVLFQPHRSISP